MTIGVVLAAIYLIATALILVYLIREKNRLKRSLNAFWSIYRQEREEEKPEEEIGQLEIKDDYDSLLSAAWKRRQL